ncbi:MAG TPA: MBL fold metallo-hydrolase [Acidobacteriota bacterium]|nr:MBL fold metallo-hydrolase [Acidobacteriota bacterium]
MKLRFLGAAETVTGSKYLIDCPEGRTLIDCGLFQGLKELRQRNWNPLPAAVESIHQIVLTHAHIDHSGYLPRMIRQGYEQPIFSTSGTFDLCTLLLPDAAKLQEEDAELSNQLGYTKHSPALPLFAEADARKTLRYFKVIPYREQTEAKGLAFTFHQAGHILGSTFVRVESCDRRVLFSGDLGRYNRPILRDPEEFSSPVDYLVLESTYGDRVHEKNPAEKLAQHVRDVYERGGKILIPAFAIGRAQEVLFIIRELENQKAVPIMPVYIDSPMAINATLFYVLHKEDHDVDMERLSKDKNPFVTQKFRIIRTHQESLMTAQSDTPAVIIAGSGMVTGGRILNHLQYGLQNPNNLVLLVGFQAEGTRGRQLQDGAREVKLRGKMIPVAAQVDKIDGLSGHGDSEDMLRWLRNFPAPPKRTFLVHGERAVMDVWKARIEKELGWSVYIPRYLEEVELQ